MKNQISFPTFLRKIRIFLIFFKKAGTRCKSGAEQTHDQELSLSLPASSFSCFITGGLEKF